MELLTLAEKQGLEARLKALIENRPVIATRIAEARAMGDLKENGDYHAAREQQGMDEAEIRRLEDRLRNVSVLDEKMAKMFSGVVVMGCTVKLREIGTDDEDLYKLVGESSGQVGSDVIEVTASSPMGEALLKSKIGEEVRVNAPRGVKRFLIVEIT
jgi:transcription elongation factor GreA